MKWERSGMCDHDDTALVFLFYFILPTRLWGSSMNIKSARAMADITSTPEILDASLRLVVSYSSGCPLLDPPANPAPSSY